MAEDTKKSSNKPMSEEERLQLCQKLDQELDDFINGLERKRYTDGWAEDRWEVINIAFKWSFVLILGVLVKELFIYLLDLQRDTAILGRP